MASIDDVGIDGFSYVWTIQNFSHCLQKPGEFFDSPSFTFKTNETVQFRLRICPRGMNRTDFLETQNTIALGLFLEDSSTSDRRVNFTPSIRTTRGSFKKLDDITRSIPIKKAKGEIILQWKELQNYLDNDTMTLRCRIWTVDYMLLPNGQCYAKTIINVERTTNIWSLEMLGQNMPSHEITTKLPVTLEMPSFVAMNFFLYRGMTFSRDGIKLEIKQVDKHKLCFLTCNLSLLETGGKVVHSIRDEHWFEASEALQVWTLPYIPLSKISNCEKPYLRCELAVSSGGEYSWVELIENGNVEDHQPSHSNLKKELNYADSWKDDLKRFYSDGMFTDVTIHTPTKNFPVHKAILCARSTVFHTMFERDMKENRTGVVDIEDIDADTVHKMLLFAYSDVVEDLDFDEASKLYFAADKYRITVLRRRCSDFFKENLSVTNVCEVSFIANMHQDDDLKSFVQDFFVEHASKVIRSVEWKRFLQDHVHLASEMMQMLLLQNLSI